ncbi:hypothetical protein AA0X95_17885 [Bacillus sp. 1P10SD]|uniref:hypothetical protein n=1 Tax=Bacillus sp. 1P10SD TaxID=3132265 RepID=UPI0039A459B5
MGKKNNKMQEKQVENTFVIDSFLQSVNNLLKEELLKALGNPSENASTNTLEQEHSDAQVTEQQQEIVVEEQVQQIEDSTPPENDLRSKIANHLLAIETDIAAYISSFEDEIRTELAGLKEINTNLLKQVSEFEKKKKEKDKDKKKKKEK